MPNELTLILSALSDGKGVGCTGTTSFFSTNGTGDGQFSSISRVGGDVLLGLGVLNLMFGGIVLCSNARTALIKLVTPEQPSECPTFGFTEPIYTPRSPKTLPTAVVSMGSPVAVPVPWHFDALLGRLCAWKLETYLDESRLTGTQPSLIINLAHEGFMCLGVGAHDSHALTITIGACGPNDRPDRVPIPESIIKTFDIDCRDALRSSKPVRRLIKRLAGSFRGENAFPEEIGRQRRSENQTRSADNGAGYVPRL